MDNARGKAIPPHGGIRGLTVLDMDGRAASNDIFHDYVASRDHVHHFVETHDRLSHGMKTALRGHGFLPAPSFDVVVDNVEPIGLEIPRQQIVHRARHGHRVSVGTDLFGNILRIDV